MIHSVWRKSHLILACISAFFLIITSITGVILSFMPISHRLNACYVQNASGILMSDVVDVFESRYDEITEIKKEDNGCLKVSIINSEGDFESFYANAITGEKVGDIEDESELFSFSRKLHRSLFMGDLGRLIIGVVAFFLFLIALSGAVLIAKRQLGWKQFFSRVTRDNNYRYWHIVLGRGALAIIVLIALTGTYLSMDRFGYTPEKKKVNHTVDFAQLTDVPLIKKRDFNLFKTVSLEQLSWIQFPFTPDIEDYFLVQTKDAEFMVNQFNGQVISRQKLGVWNTISEIQYDIHTGRGSVVWAGILGWASLNILFFIFSGYKLTLNRLKNKRKKNTVTKEECSVIVLVGSEGGSTTLVAKAFQKLLMANGKAVYLDNLNKYQYYPKMEHLVVFTSTFGNGEAPSNARLFLDKFSQVDQKRQYHFSVIGFGSTNYSHFCKYAEEVNDALNQRGREFMPLMKINGQSKSDWLEWQSRWLNKLGWQFDLTLDPVIDNGIQEDFVIVDKTEPTQASNESYLLTLRNPKIQVQSGDLIAFRPGPSEHERLYSIGKNANGDVRLSIRKHKNGKCSTYLSQKDIGEVVKGRVQPNPSFHFEQSAKRVIAICNGTGLAPFIGMGYENTGNVELHIYWGGKSREALEMYQSDLINLAEMGQLNAFNPIFSAERGASGYVQNLLQEQKAFIVKSLEEDAVIMICGSIAMRDGVFEVLNQIVCTNKQDKLQYYEQQGLIKVDCY